MNINKLHLKWKVFLFLSGFCVLLLTILWMFQTVFLDSFYRNIKIMQIKSGANSIVDNIDNKNLSELITGISKDFNVNIEVIDEKGHILYLSDVLNDSVIFKMSDLDRLALILGAQNQKGEFYEYVTVQPPRRPGRNEGFTGRLPFHEERAMQSLIYVKLAVDSSGQNIAVFMESVITPLNATVQTLRYQLYFITVIMIILATILALIIAKQVSKPIEEINKSAKELAKGNYGIHFDGKGFLEVSELSNTLNTAAHELKKVEDLRQELLANISHDLRTPLSLIYGYAEVMHDFPDEITKEQTQIIMDETQRLSSLVNDVLDISKMESGMQKIDKVPFNLTKRVKETIERIAELTRKDGYQFNFKYEEEVMVFADEISIIQAFYNLLVNAINYTGEDKVIEVDQVISNETVRIGVSDTGNGIASEDLPYIWDRYYKVDKKHKRAVTGTGLGLSIVKKIMGLHDGSYGVESQNGQGSTFWFSLKYEKIM
ncbi:alkaline phosphatase synthesis sensor protein PhoR [Oxobacter pfennigii]|uniref:histidine kinase n=1 Tax=Oxobacter pfennigii TaxID=36849 RepID=A0A0P8X0J5_9CLOT|nr:HAMP domain-containing sensor histidine kinase [Oxobacter pfennigii]KPU44283.1 alkaline phosphatase synthesis sensor protein PhoR [Oxobacter pfennigii]